LWGGRHVLETTQRHDAIKTAFSASHGYQLVRIPYWEFRRIPDVVRSLVDSPVIRTS
jgi:very-short-patch-repair endonuclease